MTRMLAIGLLTLVGVVGCGRTTPPAPQPTAPPPGGGPTAPTAPNTPPRSGVNVDTPGANVDVERDRGDGKGGVKVRAPGVNVDVDRKAPGTKAVDVDVDVKR